MAADLRRGQRPRSRKRWNCRTLKCRRTNIRKNWQDWKMRS